ncbi:MAG: hypothetical protein ACYCW6_29475 [Candidatus Xenobia bacterium]
MMDRSFLSQPEVIAASRKFVCIRLATYESAEEAAVMSRIFVGRGGRLENTVFALLTPDGQTPLSRTGRSPDFAFRDTTEMVSAMQRIASQYTPRVTAPDVPVMANLRVALDVAACDHLPLVVLSSDDLRSRVASLVWSDAIIGRAIYAVASGTDSMSAISGAAGKTGLLVVKPDVYGLKGTLVAAVSPSRPDQLAVALSDALPQRDMAREHIAEGRAQGIRWHFEIPVTDPQGNPDGTPRFGP